jgi:hypothetical protein
VIPDEERRDALAEAGVLADSEIRAKRVSPELGDDERLRASAERRARRAWLGDAALLRRAEAAEATARTLQGHLADLRRREAEVAQAREDLAAQLAERELELRRVKQREYAEQQLRVEAEEVLARVRRGHRVELERWQRRAEEAHAAARLAEERREELAANLASVSASCARLQAGIVALQDVAAELRAVVEHDRETSQSRIRELQAALELASAPGAQEADAQEAGVQEAGVQEAGVQEANAQEAGPQEAGVQEAGPQEANAEEADAEEARRREQMADALTSAVTRLRARAPVAEQPLEAQPLRSVEASLSVEAPCAAQAPRSVEEPAARTAPENQRRSEVSTVIVVPRLFAARERRARRLVPVARRLSARLARWADRAGDGPR